MTGCIAINNSFDLTVIIKKCTMLSTDDSKDAFAKVQTYCPVSMLQI